MHAPGALVAQRLRSLVTRRLVEERDVLNDVLRVTGADSLHKSAMATPFTVGSGDAPYETYYRISPHVLL